MTHPLCLQSAHRKVLDTLNSIGLSDSLLRVIDRRQTFDKLLVYGGMVRFRQCKAIELHATLSLEAMPCLRPAPTQLTPGVEQELQPSK